MTAIGSRQNHKNNRPELRAAKSGPWKMATKNNGMHALVRVDGDYISTIEEGARVRWTIHGPNFEESRIIESVQAAKTVVWRKLKTLGVIGDKDA